MRIAQYCETIMIIKIVLRPYDLHQISIFMSQKRSSHIYHETLEYQTTRDARLKKNNKSHTKILYSLALDSSQANSFCLDIFLENVTGRHFLTNSFDTQGFACISLSLTQENINSSIRVNSLIFVSFQTVKATVEVKCVVRKGILRGITFISNS